jgi:hypothetical protein
VSSSKYLVISRNVCSLISKSAFMDFDSLSYKDLQALCKEKGISSSGKKADLISRLSVLNPGSSVSISAFENLTPDNRISGISISAVSALSEAEKRKIRLERFGSQ